MDKIKFLQYASRAWDDAQPPKALEPYMTRWHIGYDLPDGGRVYFEYRGGRNNG